jgi:short-subunit dehydrogenase
MGLVGVAQMTDYCASKAALFGLHESLRYELDKQCVLFSFFADLILIFIGSYNAAGVRTTIVVPGHIMTPLFSHARFPRSRLWNFFVPSLPPITVAKAVIAALDEQHSRTLYMPFYVNFAPFLRGMPSYIRDFGQWVRSAIHLKYVGF